jgi:MYXO-CTERM domain-containing protein
MAAAVAVAVLFSTLYVLIGRPGPGVEYAALALSVIAGAILFRRRHKTSHSRVLSNPTT